MSELSAEQIRRYARHILLPDVGGIGQRWLLDASVVVTLSEHDASEQVALAYLAAAGVGALYLRGDVHAPVRDGEVAAGLLLGVGDVGRPRLAAIKERLEAINPDVVVHVAASAEVAGAMPLAEFPDQVQTDAPVPAPAPGRALATALALGGLRAATTLARIIERGRGAAGSLATPESTAP